MLPQFHYCHTKIEINVLMRVLTDELCTYFAFTTIKYVAIAGMCRIDFQNTKRSFYFIQHKYLFNRLVRQKIYGEWHQFLEKI